MDFDDYVNKKISELIGIPEEDIDIIELMDREGYQNLATHPKILSESSRVPLGKKRYEVIEKEVETFFSRFRI